MPAGFRVLKQPRLRLRSLAAIVFFMASASASAESELGVRTWFSSGMTQWARSVQDAAPIFGNPTSILTYSDLVAGSLELHGRARLGERWFVKGNLGAGRVRRGDMDDEDYFAGQVKFSDSTSAVRSEEISYATIDIGRTIWASRNGDALGIFVGWHGWRELVHAYGGTYTVGGDPPIPDDVLVISNEVMWSSLRLGLAARFAGRHGIRATAEVAVVPYTRLRNEDSHHLRQDPSDLGPVPNVINEGSGYGAQAEAEVRWAFHDSFELGLGVRYWWLKTNQGTNQGAGGTFPLVLHESERGGVTLSLSRRW